MNTSVKTHLLLLIALAVPVLAYAAAPPHKVAPHDGSAGSVYGPIAYDPSGNIIGIGSDSGVSSRYLYDPMGRLVASNVQRSGFAHEQSYSYDAYGNRTAVATGSVLTTYSVDPTTNRLAATAPHNAQYDAAGNLTSWLPPDSAVPRRYDYDSMNMMKREQVTSGSMTSSVHYIYTAEDERYWTFREVGGLNTSNYTIRDLGGKVLRDFAENSSGAFSIRRDYLYRNGQLLAAVTPTAIHHYSLDHLGTPRIVTDQDRYRVAEHTYYPFGIEITDNSPTDAPLQFTGHERNDDLLQQTTGALDYMHARFYAANLGRFLSVDPVLAGIAMRKPQGWNRYTYTFNSPLRYVDPNGKCAFQLSDGSWSFDDSVICHETTGESVDSDPQSSKAAKAAAENSALREAELLAQAEAAVGYAAGAHGLARYHMRRLYEGLVPQGSLVVGVSGSMIRFVGGEAAAGLALNTDIDSESHADATVYVGGGVGMNVGAGIYFGWIPGELSQVRGITGSVSGGVGRVGGTAIFDNQGRPIGYTGMIGKSITPISASGTVGKTWCLFGCR